MIAYRSQEKELVGEEEENLLTSSSNRDIELTLSKLPIAPSGPIKIHNNTCTNNSNEETSLLLDHSRYDDELVDYLEDNNNSNDIMNSLASDNDTQTTLDHNDELPSAPPIDKSFEESAIIHSLEVSMKNEDMIEETRNNTHVNSGNTTSQYLHEQQSISNSNVIDQSDLFGGMKVHHTFNPSHYVADNITLSTSNTTAANTRTNVSSISTASATNLPRGIVISAESKSESLVNQLISENSRLTEEIKQLRQQLQQTNAVTTQNTSSALPPGAASQRLKYVCCGGCRQWMTADKEAMFVVCSNCNSINNCNIITTNNVASETRAMTQQQRSSSMFWFMDCF